TTLSLYSRKDDEREAGVVDEEGVEEADEDEEGAALPNDYDGTAPVIKDHAVATIDVPNDKQIHVVELKAKERGLHRLKVIDRGKGASVKWPRGVPVVIESSKTVQTLLRGRNRTMYFYVPKGTKIIGGFATSRPTLVDGSGKAVATLAAGPEMFSVKV